MRKDDFKSPSTEECMSGAHSDTDADARQKQNKTANEIIYEFEDIGDKYTQHNSGFINDLARMQKL